MLAVFEWLDGYRDHRVVSDPPPPTWNRYSFDRGDVVFEMSMSGIPSTSKSGRMVTFEKVWYPDKSFSYREVRG